MRGLMVSADSLRGEIRDNSIRVVDVRRAEEYSKSHIPGSVNLPLSELLSDDSPERVAGMVGLLGIDDETRVAVYDDTFGALASRVAWTMEYLGHQDVALLDSTFSMWARLGLETDSAVPDAPKRPHSVNLRPSILATAEYLDSARQNGTAILVDNRERLNYLEQHIPGAVNIPYRTLSAPDSILRPPPDMRRLLENRRIGADDHVITYCGSVGTLSGLAYYALRMAGMENVRLYVRSFREWKSLEKPIEKQQDAAYWDLSAE